MAAKKMARRRKCRRLRLKKVQVTAGHVRMEEMGVREPRVSREPQAPQVHQLGMQLTRLRVRAREGRRVQQRMAPRTILAPPNRRV